MPSATARSAQAPGDQSHHAQGQGLYARGDREGGKGAADRLRHQIRLQQMDARRRLPARRARRRRGRPRRAEFRPARASRLHQARDRGGQHPRLRRHDGRRRAAPEARALCRVRLRQSVRPHRQAFPLGRQPHPHAGGGAAVHLRRHLQDHQHAERGDGRGLQGGLHRCPGSSASKPTRSTATARNSRSRCNASSSPTTKRTTTSSRPSSTSPRPRALPGLPRRSSRKSSSASS